ncbi:hypothetical protein [Roseibium sp.]
MALTRPLGGKTMDVGQNDAPVQPDVNQKNTLQAGIAAQAAGALPEATAGSRKVAGSAAGVLNSAADIMKSLGKMMSKAGGDALDAELAHAISKLKDVVGDVQTGKLLNDEERKRASLSDKQEKLKEAEAKQEEAKQAKEEAGFWNWVRIGFTALASAISIAVGSVLVATGVGAAIGGLMIAGGIVGLIMTADSIIQQASGKGIMGNIAYDNAIAQGMSEADANKVASDWDTGFSITMTVVSLALAVGTLGAGFSSLATATSGTVSAATQIAAKTVQVAGNISSGVATIGSSVATIGGSVTRYEAAEKSAEAQELRADGKDIEAVMQALDDFIDILMNQISGENSRFNAMLDDVMGSMKDRANTMARAQFSG